MLKKYVDAGAKGFGEHKPGVQIDDPRNMTIYAACGELKLPLLFHLDERAQHRRPRSARLGKGAQGESPHAVHRPRAGLVGVDLGRGDAGRSGPLSRWPGRARRSDRPR